MMIITSNLVSRVFPLEDGREEKHYNNLKQQQQQQQQQQSRKKLIEKFSRSCLAPMNKGLLYFEDYLQ